MKIKIVLYDKDTIMINIICIAADIISFYFIDINFMASALLFAFSIVFDLIARLVIRKNNKKKYRKDKQIYERFIKKYINTNHQPDSWYF